MHTAPLITRREWRRVLVYTLVLLVLTSLPYLLAWSNQGGEHVFTGFLFGVDDGNSYLGKMRLGARGLWDFYLFYTPEPHQSEALFFLPYILPGQIVGRFVDELNPALTTALIGVYHLMRLAFNALLIGVLYRFIAVFIGSSRLRLLALALATLGGGLGWLAALVGQGALQPEFYIPEGFSFLILLGLPHLALARAALLGGLLALFGSLEQKSPRQALPPVGLAGLCWLVVGLAVPFYLAILYFILAAWGLAVWMAQRSFPSKLALRGGTGALVTLPLFLYYTLVFRDNPAFAQWSAQNLLPSPSPIRYLLAYGLLVVPAALSLRHIWRRARLDSRCALLIAWPLVVPVLVYLPINVQRRMAEAVIVPLAILAAQGLGWLERQTRGRRVVRPLVILSSLSSAFLLLGCFLSALNPTTPVFRPAAERDALAWLNVNAQADRVVLASFDTGNVLPAYTHLRPFVGHGPETLFATDKTAVTERFYADQLSVDERRALYESFDIGYVFYGPSERALNADAPPEPAWMTGLQPIYDQGGYQVFVIKAMSNEPSEMKVQKPALMAAAARGGCAAAIAADSH